MAKDHARERNKPFDKEEEDEEKEEEKEEEEEEESTDSMILVYILYRDDLA